MLQWVLMFGSIKEILLYIAIFGGLYFQVFLLVSYFLWDGITEYGEDDVESGEVFEPIVAIMVPCYNEEDTVVGTVNSLLGLQYPREKLRIVVIDDGSKDNTWNNVQQFAGNQSVVLLQKPNEGSKYSALNFGLRHIRHNMPAVDVIGCLDADSSVHPQALHFSLREFTKPGVMAVIPTMVIDHPKTFFQHMQKVEYEIATYAKQAFSRLNTLYIAPGPFTLFKREVFDTLGEYHEAHHVEDMEIALRMQIKHMRLSHAVESMVYTKGPSTWSALLKQRVRWTYGFIMNAWDYRHIFFKDALGHVAVTLPILFGMLFVSVVMTPVLLISLGSSIVHLIQKATTIHQLPSIPDFDPFYINTSALTILGIITILCLILTLGMVRRNMLQQRLFSWDLLTLTVYSFFAAWWTCQSAWNAIRGKKKAWR